MGRDLWGTDNPERVAGEGEAPSDYRRPEIDEDAEYERHRDEEIMAEFNEGATIHAYEGSLVDDCKSIFEAGEQLKALRAEPPAENLFDKARRLNAEAADLAKAEEELRQPWRSITD
jgi:hypothetical protein